MKLAALLLPTILLAGCLGDAREPIPQEEQEQVQVHEAPGKSKAQLFAAVVRWTAENFGDSRAVLDVKDEANGTIIGKPIIPGALRIALGVYVDVQATMVIEIKDGKYRTIFNNYCIGGGVRPPITDRYELKDAQEATAKLDASLAAFLGAPARKDF